MFVVEEVVDYNINLDPAVYSVSPTTDIIKRKDLQTRPPFRSTSPNNGTIPKPRPVHLNSSSKKTPLPPPKPRRPVEMDQPKESMYFILSPTGESVLQNGPQGAYEEMEYDAEELNHNPPPLWKPPLKPPHNPQSNSSIIYSRVEAGTILDGSIRGNASTAAPTAIHGIKSATSKQHISLNAVPKQKQTSLSAPFSNRNQMKTILNDPALVDKLHEKRQQLYGPVDTPRSSVSSFGSSNPMENYEEICFDLAGANYEDSSDTEELSSKFSRVTNMTLPPRRHNIGSEVAMMQCPAEEPKVQEYLSFQPSPSQSPRESVVDLSNRHSYACVQSLSPQLQRKSKNLPKNKPELPPKGSERMRAVSPDSHQTFTAVDGIPPHARHQQALQTKKSLSQEDLQKLTSKNRPLPPRPASSSFEPLPHVPIRNIPPPVPFKDMSNSSFTIRRDMSVPMPLPDEVESTQCQPLKTQCNSPQSNDPFSPPPPPVPVRQPNASGRKIQLHDNDNAPTVPSRGMRERSIQTHELNSQPTTSSKPMAMSRPPVRQKKGTTDSYQRSNPDLQLPKSSHLPVTTKPAVHKKPAIPTKPTVNTMQSTTIKPQAMKPPVKARVKPMPKPKNVQHADSMFPRTSIINHIPPTVPPR